MYNCRTSNAWDNDLALSATHFPKTGLTLAIVYGTTIATEKDIINRLDLVRQEVVHPLLLPGLFSELERARHDQLVKKMGVMLEAKILEFQVSVEELKGQVDVDHKHQRNKAKRETWLDTVYLKNSLFTWKTQIRNMTAHAQELEEELSGVSIRALSWSAFSEMSTSSEESDSSEATLIEKPAKYEDQHDIDSEDEKHAAPDGKCSVNQDAKDITLGSKPEPDGDSEADQSTDHIMSFAEKKRMQDERRGVLRTAGRRIKGRLSTIQDEYEDWVRDCSMRVEGMAMATQWVSFGDGIFSLESLCVTHAFAGIRGN